jgi:hypothetical protein
MPSNYDRKFRPDTPPVGHWRLLIAAAVVLSFAFAWPVMAGSDWSISLPVLPGMPVAVACLDLIAARREFVGAKVLLWLVALVAGVQEAALLSVWGASESNGLLLIWITYGCGVIAGLLGVIVLLVSVAHEVLASAG